MSSKGSHGPAMALELGASKCTAAVWQHGRVVLTVNEHGSHSTPSTACLTTNGEFLVGSAAKHLTTLGVAEVDIRNVGLTPSSPHHHRQVNIANTGKSCGAATATESPSNNTFAALVALIAAMKDTAEAQLGEVVAGIVVSLPDSFSETQRHLVMEACNTIGQNKGNGCDRRFDWVRLISDTHAVALNYYANHQPAKHDDEERLAVVVSFGATHLDVVGMTFDGGITEAVVAQDDIALGGDSFTQRLASHLVEELSTSEAEFSIEREKNEDRRRTGSSESLIASNERYYRHTAAQMKAEFRKVILGDAGVIHRIHSAAETAKVQLTAAASTTVELMSPFRAHAKITSSIDREFFETILCGDLFSSFDKSTKFLSALASRRSHLKICDVIVCGGAARMPKIGQILQKNFNSANIVDHRILGSHPIAVGAGVKCHLLNRDYPPTKALEYRLKMSLGLDLCPFEYSLCVDGSMEMVPTLHANATVPTKKAVVFSTSTDFQTELNINVFVTKRNSTVVEFKAPAPFRVDGASPTVKQLYECAGQLRFTGIEPAPRGVPQLKVDLDIDPNGILNGTCVEKTTGTLYTIGHSFVREGAHDMCAKRWNTHSAMHRRTQCFDSLVLLQQRVTQMEVFSEETTSSIPASEVKNVRRFLERFQNIIDGYLLEANSGGGNNNSSLSSIVAALESPPSLGILGYFHRMLDANSSVCNP